MTVTSGFCATLRSCTFGFVFSATEDSQVFLCLVDGEVFDTMGSSVSMTMSGVFAGVFASLLRRILRINGVNFTPRVIVWRCRSL